MITYSTVLHANRFWRLSLTGLCAELLENTFEMFFEIEKPFERTANGISHRYLAKIERLYNVFLKFLVFRLPITIEKYLTKQKSVVIAKSWLHFEYFSSRFVVRNCFKMDTTILIFCLDKNFAMLKWSIKRFDILTTNLLSPRWQGVAIKCYFVYHRFFPGAWWWCALCCNNWPNLGHRYWEKTTMHRWYETGNHWVAITYLYHPSP